MYILATDPLSDPSFERGEPGGPIANRAQVCGSVRHTDGH